LRVLFVIKDQIRRSSSFSSRVRSKSRHPFVFLVTLYR
jgi:hypothetical protein